MSKMVVYVKLDFFACWYKEFHIVTDALISPIFSLYVNLVPFVIVYGLTTGGLMDTSSTGR